MNEFRPGDYSGYNWITNNRNEGTLGLLGVISGLFICLRSFHCTQTLKETEKTRMGLLDDKIHTFTYLSLVRRDHPNHLRSQVL